MKRGSQFSADIFKPVKLNIILAVCMLMFTGYSCKKADNCIEYHLGPVIKVEGPQEGVTNQKITLKVYFTCFNGCGLFDYIDEDISGKTYTIQVNAIYDGCLCADIFPTLSFDYTFKTNEIGTYTFNFAQGNDAYLTHTIEIGFEL